MAVSILALVIALSSSATAAVLITGAQIKNHTVSAKDLKTNAVNSTTVKDHSLQGRDLKTGAVKSKQVRDHSLKGKDLKGGTLTGTQVRDHSLTGLDILAGSLTGAELADGSVTNSKLADSSVTSSKIADGTITQSDISSTLVQTFTSGAAGFEVVTANSAPAGLLLVPVTATATCPAGKVAISANAYWLGKTNVAPPQVRRNGPASFTAETSFFVNVVGVDVVQLQLTCVTS